jgi:glutamate 5-kinase
MADVREPLTHSRRIVIKVGTRVATEGDNAFSAGVIGSLVRQIASLKDSGAGETGAHGEGRSFIIVSSGAIALGLNRMGMKERPREINLLQAAAAMGQSRLMHAYEREFEAVRTETAQILLTSEDIRSRARYLNIRNTIFTLWSFGVVPIVNENDTVSYAEIFRFADNDIISAHIANMLDADLLVILTDTDGVYDHNPRTHADARVLRTVEKVTETVIAGAEGKGSTFSSGGMESKVRAADIATRSGVGVVIARGEGIDLPGILAGREIGTYFVPAVRRMKGRKKWMAFNPRTEGSIVVDRGAERAILRQGRSLLPAGVTDVRGTFAIGSVISILDEDGREVARGLSNFASEELEKIRGLNTKRISEVLGVEEHFDEVVHRDNLVVVASSGRGETE